MRTGGEGGVGVGGGARGGGELKLALKLVHVQGKHRKQKGDKNPQAGQK